MNELQAELRAVEAAWVDLLYSRVAPHLAGRPVILEWQTPLLPGARGLTLRSGDKALIQIDPDLDREQRLETFLHECAHARLHFDRLADKSDFENIPEVRASKGKYAAPDWLMDQRRAAANKREHEARAQAEKWLALAGEGTIKKRLTRLLEVKL